MTCDSKINLFENISNPNDIKVLGLHCSQRLKLFDFPIILL